ncbi:MAG: EAL domain-containing protein [Gammaproteobacteria bacterium]|jgi:diguanylate cyclase (GGDEF)-like protein|nr:EAL domain-containing protein [Gammaproteobacteria bacterium]
MKLLLVEDNPADADFLAASLRRQRAGDVELVNVPTLAAATEQLGLDTFDVVLLDLHLPDGSGLQCLDAIQAINTEIPIVVLSGQDDEDFAVSILTKGAQDYLVKWEGQGRTILRSIRYAIERKKSDLRLNYLAQYDPLTGIPNRQFFNDQLTRATARARREGRKVSLLFLDLDAFKVVNDTLGHDSGDRLLKEVADRIRRSVRTGDVVARLGGDEFAVMLEGLSSPLEVEALASGLLEVIAQPYHIADRQVSITTSIGITMYPNDNSDTQMLLKNADIAMYQAKEFGRNNFKFFHEQMHADLMRYHELERDIREAITEGQFHLAYQPKINVRINQLQGLEALLRWNSPTRGRVSPADFIPVAEESGHIIPLGYWVLNEVCHQLRVWQDKGLSPVPVSVNVSARQFQQADFHKRVAEVLRRHDVDPSLLEIELTEGLVMDDTEAAQRELAELKKIGVRISIDDFGTGYSCLSYLRRFPLDVLKIDRSFVQEIGSSRDGESIIDAIISLARSLRLETVAEGVETTAQLHFLLDRGCHVVQGFLFGKPMDMNLVEPLLNALEGGDTDSTAVKRVLKGVG